MSSTQMSSLRFEELDGYKQYKTHIQIFLINGIKITGVISNFDYDCIVLTDGGIVNWDVISTVCASK